MLGFARWGRRLILAGAVGLVTGAGAIAYVSHLEQDNHFCVSCHTREGTRLHGELFDRYAAAPPPDLAAAHRAAKRSVTCIDCHGGVGVGGRSRILLIAAWDAARYVVGQFEEPDHMRFPLRDRECVWCHGDYNLKPFPEGGQAGGREFHLHPDHRTLPLACIDCHASHVRGDPRLGFLNNHVVLPHCRRCHKEMGTEQVPG